MTEVEKEELGKRSAVRKFLKEQKMSAFDLNKITKEFCACGTCRFYTQHYTKDGNPVDWGHCYKGNIQHSKKPSTSACGFWEDYEEEPE